MSFQTEHFTLGINENGANFEEDIEIDEERDTVIFRVPAHNNVVSASFLIDFKVVSWKENEQKHLPDNYDATFPSV